jgi:general secretion pathway protein A
MKYTASGALLRSRRPSQPEGFPMHEEYYGFTEKPFSLTPDPKYLYKSHSHANAFDVLQYAIRRREGFIVVTGDIGTGKTTLCRAVLDELDRKTFTALVLNPFLTEEELLRLILQDFGVVSRDELQRGRLAGISKQELIDTLNAFLLSLLPLGAGALLIIDEAQNLPPEVLEQIRILSNLETDKEKLLQIVLVGQLNLQEKLKSPGLRQLDQRVSIRCELNPLTREETAAYIAHRLAIAGGATAVSFLPKAIDRVHRHSGGIPRLINMVCDRALLGGYSARTATITPEIVDSAAASLELDPPRSSMAAWMGRRGVSFAAGAAVMALIASVTYAALTLQDERASADALGQPAPVVQSAEPSSGAAAGSASLPPPAAPAGDPAAQTSRQQASGPPVAPSEGVAATAGVGSTGRSGRYSVVVGSFRQSDEAQRLVAELRGKGYEVRARRIDSGTRGVWHQVFVGPYSDIAEARQAETRLQRLPGYADARLVTR